MTDSSTARVSKNSSRRTPSTRMIRIRRLCVRGSRARGQSSSHRAGRWQLHRRVAFATRSARRHRRGRHRRWERIRLRQGRLRRAHYSRRDCGPSVWSRSNRGLGHSPTPIRAAWDCPQSSRTITPRGTPFQNHSASPSTATAGPPANETGFVVLNRNKKRSCSRRSTNLTEHGAR